MASPLQVEEIQPHKLSSPPGATVTQPRVVVSSPQSYSRYLPPDFPPEGRTDFSFQDFFDASCADEAEKAVDFNMPKSAS
jgi:hypothetical protein